MTDGSSFCSRWSPRLLSVLRVVTALLYMQHGGMKLLGWPHSEMFKDLKLFSILGLAGILELFGGAMLAAGLFTRTVAFILSGEMAVAYFMVHAPKGFFPALNQGELAVLYCFVFLYFSAAGPGAWAVDGLICKRHGTCANN